MLPDFDKDILSLFSVDKTIDQLFEKQVKQTPNNTAVVYESGFLTYRDLNEKTNRLAHYLKKSGVTRETPIGVFMKRSVDTIIAILSILKSGGTCVPLDMAEPSERLLKIIDDTKLSIILGDKKSKDQLTNFHSRLIFLDVTQDFLEPNDNIFCKQHGVEHLAFLVYTSGSTGVPKGVMLPHRVFSRCEFWAKDIFCFTSADRFLFKSMRAPEEFLFPLFIGATLVIAPSDAEKDPALFVQAVIKNKISVVNVTPSFLGVLLDCIDQTESACVKHVFCAGEILSVELQKRFFSCLSAYLYNFYGLAEAPYTAYQRCNQPQAAVLIGKPVDATLYILDAERQPVPMGVVGELYIGGAGLARGYLNQAELTATRFIVNPFQENTRLYKTGDLVRYLADGNIEYIGRDDFQVKIRGFRVELGEIEQRLLQYSGIKQAVVLAKKTQQEGHYQYLVAYYIADHILDEEAILNDLSNHLPDYMLPSLLVFMEKFPLNTNGKLDRKSLPQPDWKSINIYVAPRNKIEQSICDIYAELLGISVNSISVQTNFFRLGGNSILAIQVAHRLSRLFAIYLPIVDIFRTKTIRQLAELIATIKTKNQVIPITEKLTHYPLSFAQERLWFIEQYEQGVTAYHIPMLVKLKKNVSINNLKRALQAIVKRHEILRTVFVRNALGQEFQCVRKAPLKIKIRCCKTFDEYQQCLKKDLIHPFCLRREYPIRVCLYEIAKTEDNYLLVTMHHVASDGWSTGIFQQELIAYYEYYQCNKALSLPMLSIQYKDFAIWQKNHLSSHEFDTQLNYWCKRLRHHETLHLAHDKPRPPNMSYAGTGVNFCIAAELSEQLRAFAQAYGCSLYTILLSGFYVLLYKYSGQEDIVIGSPIANRHYESIEHLIGFFINMLAQREQLALDQPITHLIAQIHQHLIEAQQYQDIPFEKLIQALKVERDTSRHPLFQVIFAVQNFSQKEKKFENYYDVIDISKFHAATHFDIEFLIDDSQSTLHGKITYATNLFAESTMRRWIEHYKNILTQMMNETYKPLKMYQVLSVEEYREIIYDWNRTRKIYPEHKTIHQLFEEQAQRTPDHVAVVYKNIQLTYKSLNEKANQLAHYLHETYAIAEDDLIALCVKRSAEMLISILGVLKSGAAYVPIDFDGPEERARYILHDTQPKLVIIHQGYDAAHDGLIKSIPTLIVDSPSTREMLNKQPVINLALDITSRSLMYVIYTSGTTGNPKGVMIEHRSVGNTLWALKNVYELSLGEKSVAFTHYTFDVSVAEFFSALLSGAELHILCDDIRKDVALISAYIQSHAIHYVYLPPMVLSLLPRVAYPYLRGIIYAGEACDASTGSYWSSQCKLFNYYGPTEAAIYALGKQVIHDDVHLIGKPIANTTAYILNNDLTLVPIGSIGELYIGGIGLARGYLNQPELTDRTFIPHPFQQNERLYKTGDLVRYLPDGNVEYIGRNDFQIKIRGFRIELGEIENRLCLYPGIKQAVVMVQKHRHNNHYQYLIGYYVADLPLNETDILSELSSHLPEYMLPNALVFLKELPVTMSGKINRKVLPQSECKHVDIYVSPRNKTEHRIRDIYAKILGLPAESISIYADFFQLGGNSIMAMQLAFQLRQLTDRQLPIIVIFQNRTIEKLAQSLQEARCLYEVEDFIIPLRERGPELPLFMIPGAHGENFTLFMPIVTHIKFNCPIYGIHSKVSDIHWKVPNTLRQQAEAIFKSIRKIQPRGPYHFFSLCLGGYLAIQLQQLAEEQGEPAGIVFLINSQPVFNKKISLTSEKPVAQIKSYYRKLRQFFLTLKKHSFKNIGRQLREVCLRDYVDIPRKTKKYHQLLCSGNPVCLKSELHLLLASDEHSPELILNNWRTFFQGNTSLYHLNGDHGTCFKEYGVITAIIDEALFSARMRSQL